MIVREDSMTLYGFADSEARDLFSTLLGVSGWGQDRAGHPGRLRRHRTAAGTGRRRHRRTDPVPGIGKRGAERMVLELRGQDRCPADRARFASATGHAVRAPSWKPLWALALRPSKPRKRATPCLPPIPRPPLPVHCGRRCPCWVRPNEQVRRRRSRRRGARRLSGADGRRGDVDASLRPRSLGEFIGQPESGEQLQLVLEVPRTAAAHRITSCCRVRLAWARRRWR